MAMIQCPNCGKDISDKASTCPGCGAKLEAKKDIIPEKRCEECGIILEEGVETCPNCGCPVENVAPATEKVQKVEVSGVSVNEKQKKIILASVISVIAVIVLIFGGMQMKKHNDQKAAQKAKQEYQKSLKAASTSMLLGAAEAEKCGQLIHDVWYDTIYDKYDATTFKYTSGHSDFNDSLTELFSDSKFTQKIDSIKSNQKLVNGCMKNLKNPPEEYEEAYDAMKDLYDSYTSLVNCAIDPSGNLTTYTSTFNDADKSFSKNYDTIKMYTEE